MDLTAHSVQPTRVGRRLPVLSHFPARAVLRAFPDLREALLSLMTPGQGLARHIAPEMTPVCCTGHRAGGAGHISGPNALLSSGRPWRFACRPARASRRWRPGWVLELRADGRPSLPSVWPGLARWRLGSYCLLSDCTMRPAEGSASRPPSMRPPETRRRTASRAR